MDRFGFVTKKPSFSFFLRTTNDICNAVADWEQAGRKDILRQHLARIDDPRLRRAFLAVFDLEPQEVGAVPGSSVNLNDQISQTGILKHRASTTASALTSTETCFFPSAPVGSARIFASPKSSTHCVSASVGILSDAHAKL
jgi:hypothetical protein